MKMLVNPHIFREHCASLTNFHLRYNLNGFVYALRCHQTLLGGQRSAEHSAALRCHGRGEEALLALELPRTDGVPNARDLA